MDGRMGMTCVPPDFPAAVHVQITRNVLGGDQLVQRSDAVLDAGQRPDSRVLQHQGARAAAGPCPHLLRLKYRHSQGGRAFEHVVRRGQSSESGPDNGNVYVQADRQGARCHGHGRRPHGIAPGMGCLLHTLAPHDRWLLSWETLARHWPFWLARRAGVPKRSLSACNVHAIEEDIPCHPDQRRSYRGWPPLRHSFRVMRVMTISVALMSGVTLL